MADDVSGKVQSLVNAPNWVDIILTYDSIASAIMGPAALSTVRSTIRPNRNYARAYSEIGIAKCPGNPSVSSTSPVHCIEGGHVYPTVEPWALTSRPRPVGGSHCSHRADPSTGSLSGAVAQTYQQLTPFRRVMILRRVKGEGHGGVSIGGDRMNLGGPAATLLADRMGSVLLSAPGRRVVPLPWRGPALPLRCDKCDLFPLQGFKHPVRHYILRPAVRSVLDRLPVSEAGPSPPSLAFVLGDIDDRVHHLLVGILTLPRRTGSADAMRSQ